MNNIKFMSCPFCGKNPRVLYQGRFCTIMHKNCTAGFDIVGTFESEDKAIKAWNTRNQIPCETCSQMSNPNSFISHLMQANVWELKDIIRRIESEVLDTLSDNGDDWFASSKVYDAIEIIKEYIEN